MSSSSIKPPAVTREYRAAWVATVGNIDWPSAPGLSTTEQKAELVALLDHAKGLKLNTIILQVRPACDALYASKIEPWSEYLTGTMGKPPEPFYDPLAFAVTEAHRRGLELHAWFNPYRARHASAKSPVAATHISKLRPDLVRSYGRSLWLDPGEKDVQDYSLKVVMDVVTRYDVDGVHFDDYFYPYKEQDRAGNDLPFPDDSSWKRFGAGGKLSRDDWRRQNVNVLIQRVYQSIKAAKPWVKFGISPFGIWRPGNPPQIKGYDAYEKLYADSRKWLEAGWCDYFVPQLYWAIDPPDQSFPVLLAWWAKQNPKHRQLLAGMDSTRTIRRWKPEEIVRQIALTRKQPGTAGHVHWNLGALVRNQALDSALDAKVYQAPAVPPAAPWLEHSAPQKPQVRIQTGKGDLRISWEKPTEPVRTYIVQYRCGQRWATELIPGTETSYQLSGSPPEAIAVTAVDRYGKAGRPGIVSRGP